VRGAAGSCQIKNRIQNLTAGTVARGEVLREENVIATGCFLAVEMVR